MTVTVIGEVTSIGETQQVTESFKKAEVIIKTVEEYPQFYLVEFTQDKVDLTDTLTLGRPAKIFCNLQGREYTSKDGNYNIFMSLKAWKVEAI